MRYQYWTGDPPTGSLESWLEKTQQHPGSWWPDWQAWIEGLDGERVPAREIGAGVLKPIEDAPGSYVRSKTDQPIGSTTHVPNAVQRAHYAPKKSSFFLAPGALNPPGAAVGIYSP